MSDQYRDASAAQGENWDLAQYALQRNRETLMARFIEIVGPPSNAVDVVHSESINGRMEPEEMIDYAGAVREIIFSIETTSGEGLVV
jgi:hypothetical protein